MLAPRRFRCEVQMCKEFTEFDLRDIKNPDSNFVVCSKCGKKWFATITSACCNKIDILFILESSGPNTKKRSSLQSFKKA